MSKKSIMSLGRLETILETYGADRARWPEAERDDATYLIAQDAAARRLFDEHAALEKLLEALPEMTAGQALKDRILAAAVNDGETQARVIPIDAAKQSPEAAGLRKTGSLWPAAALAASFAFGLYLGVAGLGDEAYQEAVQFSGLGADAGEASSWLDIGSGSGSEGIL